MTTTPFHDLDDFIALPRISGLTLSPDGSRLVTSVSTLNSESNRFVTALWEVDPAGKQPAKRLTRSAKGEAHAAFLPDSSLLFTSARPDPAAEDDSDAVSLLWHLPFGGGEAYVVAKRPGGIDSVSVAEKAGTVVVSSNTFRSATDLESEEKIRKERKDKKISAILHDQYPIRFWDHDLGPDGARLFAGTLSSSDKGLDPRIDLRDLTSDVGNALHDESTYDVSRDGSTVVASWGVMEQGGMRFGLVAIDVATGERKTLCDEEEYEYWDPRISPDGSHVAAIRERRSTPDEPVDDTLVLVSLTDGSMRELTRGWDRWPTSLRWLPDGSGLVVVADDNGRAPIFRIDIDNSGGVTQLTADDYAYSDAVVSPDGQTIYALRTSCTQPPIPVRLSATKRHQSSTPLLAPTEPPAIPGSLVEIEAEADDGARVHGWLALPEGASRQQPAPLLTWIHGGPLGSWNGWNWRWNPWPAVSRGYAVLMPDPALSTGYGLDFIRRGWGSWGGAPFTDLMAITDIARAREDIDEKRIAAMGGSFGGYMANWMAGKTDQFRAFVTHASLWELEGYGAATDAAHFWRRELTPEAARAHSPHQHVAAITTPMLVIHGDKDYRVPIGEALKLWYELAAVSGDENGVMPHKFLYFPDENHWVLAPQHAKLWYETVLAFLDHHVLGKDWKTPELLR